MPVSSEIDTASALEDVKGAALPINKLLYSL